MSSIGARGTARRAVGRARGAANGPWVERLARVGLAARGLLYVLIGLLAAQIALGGSSSHSADQRGAFQTLAQNGLGRLLLWLVVLGFLGYAAWQASEAGWGHHGERTKRKRTAKRVESAVKAVIYVALAVAAFRTVTAGGAGQGGETLTAKVLQMPTGQWLVGLVGLVIAAAGAVQVHRGMRTEFEKQLQTWRMSSSVRKASVRLGQVGYVARGVVFGIVGILVVAAAVTFDPSKARGFDAALKELAAQPYGVWLLLVVAVGLVCFGAHSFVESRYRRL